MLKSIDTKREPAKLNLTSHKMQLAKKIVLQFTLLQKTPFPDQIEKQFYSYLYLRMILSFYRHSWPHY